MTVALWRRIRRHVETGRETLKVDLKLTLQLSGAGEQAEFVKDVTAIANTPGGDGYLIIGIQDNKNRGSNSPCDYIVGFSTPGGSDEFERTATQILTKFCNKVPVIEYHELPHPDCGNNIGVVTIRRSHTKPYSLIRSSSGIEQHQVWIRRGTASYPATPDEIVTMSNTPDVPDTEDRSRYVIGDIVDLQAIRDDAREKRATKQ